MNFQSTTKNVLAPKALPIKKSNQYSFALVGKSGKRRAARRNALGFHCNSSRLRAPKKMIRARFAAEEERSLLTDITNLILPTLSTPVTPPAPLVRVVSNDAVSVVSKDDEDDDMRDLSNHLLSCSLFNEPNPSRNIVSPTLTLKKSKRVRFIKSKAAPRKKKTRTKKFLSIKHQVARADPEEKWMGMFRELVAYKKKHNGSTQVSSQHGNNEYVHLGFWVKVQRRLHVRNRLSERRTKLLDSIGFFWNVHAY